MSGHSHAKTVAATKNANDAKKGKIFSKMGRLITIAVKEKGADPSVNASLKSAMERARDFNMPKENIERAIKKGTGELAGETLEEVSFEALGPGGIAIIIDGITDNKNRTLGEIKGIVSQHNGKLAGEGAVRWMFEKRGLINIALAGKTREELEMAAIEAGADDVRFDNEVMHLFTQPQDLETVKKALQEKGLIIDNAQLGFMAKEEVSPEANDREKLQRLFDALDENDAVQEIYSNLKA